MAYNRFAIFKRDGFRCRYCGKQAAEAELHVDHIHPRAKGGTDDPLNLGTACRSCNLSKRCQEIEWKPCCGTVDANGMPLNCPQFWPHYQSDHEAIFLEEQLEWACQSIWYDLRDQARDRGEDPNGVWAAWESLIRPVYVYWGHNELGNEQCNESGWWSRRPTEFLPCSPNAEVCG